MRIVVTGATGMIGMALIQEAINQGHEVCAIIRKNSKRKLILDSLKTETRTTIIYESPHHLKSTLAELYSYIGNRKVTLCRELTKVHEEVIRGTLEELLHHYDNAEPRGEYVLVTEGVSFKELELKKQEGFESMSIEEHMKLYTDKGMDKKEAMKFVAADRGISKRDVYSYLIEHACN